MSWLSNLRIPGQWPVVCCLTFFEFILSSTFGFAQPNEKNDVYQVDGTGWVESTIPDAGEVFTCMECNYPVQIRIIYSPASSGLKRFNSNEDFLQALSTDHAQRTLARLVMKDQVAKKASMDILKTSISELGGLKVFLFQAAAKLDKGLSRWTIMMAVHRKRIVTVSLNYFEGGMDDTSRHLVRAFLSSFQFLSIR